MKVCVRLYFYLCLCNRQVSDIHSTAIIYAVQTSSDDQPTDANKAHEEKEKEEEEEEDENAWQFCKACDKTFTTIQVSRNRKTLIFHLYRPVGPCNSMISIHESQQWAVHARGIVHMEKALALKEGKDYEALAQKNYKNQVRVAWNVLDLRYIDDETLQLF